MKTTIKMFELFRVISLIWKRRSIIAQFWFSKSFFCVKNQPNLSDFFSLQDVNIREELLLLTVLLKWAQILALDTKLNSCIRG